MVGEDMTMFMPIGGDTTNLYNPVECSLVKLSHERVHAKKPVLGIHPKEGIPQNEKLYSWKCYCSIFCNTKKSQIYGRNLEVKL